MHKNPYKHRIIAGSSKCSTKPLSIHLTKLLTHIKQGLKKHCETAYSKSGVNQMWILKNSKESLEHLESPNFNHITSIKSFDFSTFYTTIPHQKFKSRLASIIRNSFIHKNGNRRYKFLVLGHEGPYFVKEHSDSKNKYTEDDIINILEFLVDNIFVVFVGKVFQQTVGISMGTNCAPLLADISLYSYEADFIQSLLSTGKKTLASQFNFTYRYIDDVLSVNNPDFDNYLRQMYPAELEIKNTTRSNTSASYLDFTPVDQKGGQLRTSLYDKRDDFNFHITNFPFLSSNIPSSPAYGVFISHTVCQGLLLLWMFYSEGGTTFILAPRTGLCHGTFEIVLQEVLWSISGYHQTLWSPPLPNVTWHSGTWSYTKTPSIDQTLNQFANLLPNSGLVPFGTCICSNVETILSWTCHVYGPFEFRTSLGTSILLVSVVKGQL